MNDKEIKAKETEPLTDETLDGVAGGLLGMTDLTKQWYCEVCQKVTTYNFVNSTPRGKIYRCTGCRTIKTV